uniref:Protochlorophyllide reductase n=1 Tax=Craspedostauros australis TaxID=1486917 RepID=A0A7R9WZW2_9STRA
MLNILVTGASDGIGLALSKQLVAYHKAKVFLCARNPAKGADALKAVVEHGKASLGKSHDAESMVELVIMDVGVEESVAAAAKQLADKGVKLNVIVNNAGIAPINATYEAEDILNVNLHGPKRVVDHFSPLFDASASCRIVHTGSGAGPMFVAKHDENKQQRLCDPNITWEGIQELESEGWEKDSYKGYGLSKALLACYSMALAKQHDAEKIASYCLTPGFVNTKMTKGRGANLTPEEGTSSLRHCIFKATPDQSGWYFGSDSERSPLHALRSPGEPAFDGVYPWDKQS